jgi:hypothetical protein
MTKVLYFHSDREAELINAKVNDGMIEVNEKTFIPGNDFILLRKRQLFNTVTEPLYILKWDSLFSANIKTEVKNRSTKVENTVVCPNCQTKITSPMNTGIRNIISTVTFTKDVSQTPESLYKTLRLKMLGGMLKIRKEFKLLPLIIGLLIGVVMLYLMMYLKILPSPIR